MVTKKISSIDPKITHPEPDTSANESKDGKSPPTWNPGKVTQPSEDDSEESKKEI